MNLLSNTNRRWIVSVAATVQFASVSLDIAPAHAAGVSPSPAFASPDIKPTLRDFLTARPVALAKKLKTTDPLLKPPFAGAPTSDLKGLAAGIRAKQLDIPNRVKAAAYLGTVDCVTFPEAQEMLIDTMLNDPSEEVRFEAVMALRNMLTRGCCNMDTSCECESCCNRKKIAAESERYARKNQRILIREAKGPAKKAAKKAKHHAEAEDERYDCCRGCQSPDAMKALMKVAMEKDNQCCWLEPSERVRLVATEALCLFRSYSNGYMLPEPIPEPEPDPNKPVNEKEKGPSNEQEKGSDSGINPDNGKGPPVPGGIDNTSTKVPQDIPPLPPAALLERTSNSAGMAFKTVAEPVDITPALKAVAEPVGMPIVSGLRGRCIVALKSRKLLQVDPRFSSVYEEHTYHFSSAEAKAAFEQDPKQYAPAYGGIDPVEWLAKHQTCEGQFLREYDGRFYLFVSKENWEIFRSNPQRYVLRPSAANVRMVSGQQ